MFFFDNSFTVHENSFAIIFGPSGSGRAAAILNVLSALEPPTSGTVEIANQDIYRLNADQRAHFRAQTIGIVATKQTIGLKAWMYWKMLHCRCI